MHLTCSLGRYRSRLGEKLCAIYSKDIATGEGAEGFDEAVTNLAIEIDAEERQRGEEDRMSRETPRRSVDS